MQQKGFQSSSKKWETGKRKQSNGDIRDIDSLKEGYPVQREQRSLPQQEEAITGSLRTQRNTLEPASCQKHQARKGCTPKDNKWSRQDTEFAENSGNAKKEDSNI